jgi:hypothetical protein
LGRLYCQVSSPAGARKGPRAALIAEIKEAARKRPHAVPRACKRSLPQLRNADPGRDATEDSCDATDDAIHDSANHGANRTGEQVETFPCDARGQSVEVVSS